MAEMTLEQFTAKVRAKLGQPCKRGAHELFAVAFAIFRAHFHEDDPLELVCEKWCEWEEDRAKCITASLDAAMSLVPEGCLFMARTLWDDEGERTAGCANVSRYKREGNGTFWQGDFNAISATPALALTAASLRALAEQQP